MAKSRRNQSKKPASSRDHTSYKVAILVALITGMASFGSSLAPKLFDLFTKEEVVVLPPPQQSSHVILIPPEWVYPCDRELSAEEELGLSLNRAIYYAMHQAVLDSQKDTWRGTQVYPIWPSCRDNQKIAAFYQKFGSDPGSRIADLDAILNQANCRIIIWVERLERESPDIAKKASRGFSVVVYDRTQGLRRITCKLRYTARNQYYTKHSLDKLRDKVLRQLQSF